MRLPHKLSDAPHQVVPVGSRPVANVDSAIAGFGRRVYDDALCVFLLRDN